MKKQLKPLKNPNLCTYAQSFCLFILFLWQFILGILLSLILVGVTLYLDPSCFLTLTTFIIPTYSYAKLEWLWGLHWFCFSISFWDVLPSIYLLSSSLLILLPGAWYSVSQTFLIEIPWPCSVFPSFGRWTISLLKQFCFILGFSTILSLVSFWSHSLYFVAPNIV